MTSAPPGEADAATGDTQTGYAARAGPINEGLGSVPLRRHAPIEGGEPRTCADLESEDWPIRWSADGASIYVARHRRITTQMFRVELASGRRTLLWELGARDPVGAD